MRHPAVRGRYELGDTIRYPDIARGSGTMTAVIFSFIAMYIQQPEDMQIVCATGTVGFVTIACSAHATGIAVEHIRLPVRVGRSPAKNLFCNFLPLPQSALPGFDGNPLFLNE